MVGGSRRRRRRRGCNKKRDSQSIKLNENGGKVDDSCVNVSGLC